MRRERGIALLIALVVVSLATILATRIGTDSAINQRRAGNIFLHEQAMQVALGAEVWAQEVLALQFVNANTMISLDQPWATQLPPLPIEGGTVLAGLEDMQGRFNLNNVVDGNGVRSAFGYEQFQRLLALLQLEPKWAPLLLDWIDRDNLATLPDGAEDGVYLSQVPPYLAANQPITSTSELLSLPGFGIERYRKLEPYVAVLPVGTKINPCTASAVVLASLASNMPSNFVGGAAQLLSNRKQGCFPTIDDLANGITDPKVQKDVRDGLKTSSLWFRATVIVSIGTTEFSLYTLFNVNAPPFPRPVLRSIGTE